jgi:hypothetical protein
MPDRRVSRNRCKVFRRRVKRVHAAKIIAPLSSRFIYAAKEFLNVKRHPLRPSPMYSPGTDAIPEKTESFGSRLRTSGKCSGTCFAASNRTHSHVGRSPTGNKSTSGSRGFLTLPATAPSPVIPMRPFPPLFSTNRFHKILMRAGSTTGTGFPALTSGSLFPSFS